MVPLPKRIEEWAKTNELRIVSAERRWFFAGPFMLRRKVGRIYRIVVRDRNEDMGEGWLSLQSSNYGKEWEEVKWVRKPAHTVDQRTEDEIALQVHGGASINPKTAKWSFGFFIALSLIGCGVASLAYGAFVVPSRGNHVIVGIPALLLAWGLIFLGLGIHLAFFWGVASSPNARTAAKVLLFGGAAFMLLGLCVGLLSLLIRLAA